MSSHACQELNFGRRVALVGFEVEEDADERDRDELEEVERQEVRLWAVRLPVLGKVWAAKGSDAGAWFGGRHRP